MSEMPESQSPADGSSDASSTPGPVAEPARAAGSTPQISVIVPVGRVDDDLPIQLRALAGQRTDRTFEVVLACNTDDPAERSRLEREAESAGVGRVVPAWDRRSAAHARNAGAAAARAEILAFCDGDDIVDPGWLEALVGALEPGAAVGGHLDEDRLAVPGQEHWRPPATPGELPTFMGHPYLVTANQAVWRSDFEAVGGFDLGLVRCEDIAFSFELLRRGVELRYAAEAVVHYRHRKGLKPMLEQHYLYGRGMAQVLARIGVPDADGGSGGGLASLKPNGQKVDHWTIHHVLRKGALGVGRVVGTLQERRRPSVGTAADTEVGAA